MVGLQECVAKEKHERKTPAKVTQQEEDDEISLFYSDLMPLLVSYTVFLIVIYYGPFPFSKCRILKCYKNMIFKNTVKSVFRL